LKEIYEKPFGVGGGAMGIIQCHNETNTTHLYFKNRRKATGTIKLLRQDRFSCFDRVRLRAVLFTTDHHSLLIDLNRLEKNRLNKTHL